MRAGTYEQAMAEAVRRKDRRVRNDFLQAFDAAIARCASPRAAKRVQAQYLRRCRYPLERAQVLRYGEMIAMWESAPTD